MQFFTKNDSGEMVETEAFTKQQVEDAVRARVDERKDKFADYDDLKASLTTKDNELATQKTDFEKQLQLKDEAIKGATLGTARVEIRHEFGLSKDLDKFLVGDSEEDIRKNAEILKKNGGTGGVTFDKDTGNLPPESPSKELATSLFGKK